jgi:hypothetical protein
MEMLSEKTLNPGSTMISSYQIFSRYKFRIFNVYSKINLVNFN